MAKRIKMDTDDEIVYRTSKLYQRHKEIIQYIEENENINVSYLKNDSTKCNTREIGRRLFVWHSENSK